MYIKNYKYVVVGIIIGLLSSISIQGFANTNNIVQAYLTNYIKFEFNGVEENLNDEYVVLNYNERTYVPARFVAEKLGAEVIWVEKTNTIKIKSPQSSIIKKEKSPDETTKNYSEVPVSKDFYDLLIGITTISYDDNYWRVYIKLENKDKTPLQLIQHDTKIKVDEIEYSMQDVPVYLFDSRWYNDIREDDTLEGYITLPKLHKDPEKLNLTLTILENDRKQEKREVEFNLKF